MSQTHELQQQIAQLSALEQIARVEAILHWLDAPDPAVDALWATEVARQAPVECPHPALPVEAVYRRQDLRLAGDNILVIALAHLHRKPAHGSGRMNCLKRRTMALTARHEPPNRMGPHSLRWSR